MACYSPHNDVPLATVKSPLLEREGYTQNEFEKTGNAVPTMEGLSRTTSSSVLISSWLPSFPSLRMDVCEAEVAAPG